MGFGEKLANRFRNDQNFSRVRPGIVGGAKAALAGSRRYALNKVPIVQWLPTYMPRWIIGDMIAGLSVGLLLIPQAVIYAAVARVPVQQALLASWLPGVIYAVMGTSRDISIGPTLLGSQLTGQIVLALSRARIPPAFATAVISFSIGVWSLIFGMLNLGFIFDFVSIPIVMGSTMGISFSVITRQIPTLIGEVGITNNPLELVKEIIMELPKANPATIGVGLSSILVLALLQFVGSKWGKNNEIVRLICTSRNIIVIILFTGLSFFFNNKSPKPFWTILGPTTTKIIKFQPPNPKLIQSLFFPSITIFFLSSLEHITLAKAFGYNSEYSIDASQEMVSLGIVNIANSMFGALPVGGGDIARTSLNAASGVNSPIGGVFTSIFVFVSMYTLGNVLKWLPNATVAAVIMVAIVDKMPPQALLKRFWKISFANFVEFFIALNITLLLASAGFGIGSALVFLIIYTLLRVMFSRPTRFDIADIETPISNSKYPGMVNTDSMPTDLEVIRLETDVTFLNADRIKRHIINTVFTHYSGSSNEKPTSYGSQRIWNSLQHRYIESLRRAAGIKGVTQNLPRFRVLVLDLSSTSFVDSSGLQAFEDIKKTLREYGGDETRFRFVGVNKEVKRRFKRSGWTLVSPYESHMMVDGEEGPVDLVFHYLTDAIQYRSLKAERIQDEKLDWPLEKVQQYGRRFKVEEASFF